MLKSWCSQQCGERVLRVACRDLCCLQMGQKRKEATRASCAHLQLLTKQKHTNILEYVWEHAVQEVCTSATCHVCTCVAMKASCVYSGYVPWLINNAFVPCISNVQNARACSLGDAEFRCITCGMTSLSPADHKASHRRKKLSSGHELLLHLPSYELVCAACGDYVYCQSVDHNITVSYLLSNGTAPPPPLAGWTFSLIRTSYAYLFINTS